MGDFLSHVQSIEQQLEHEVPDWVGRMLVMTGVHPHLKETLMLQDRLGNTCLELEEALRSIEEVETAPAGITVKKSYNIARGDSSVKKTTHKKKRSNLLTVGDLIPVCWRG